MGLFRQNMKKLKILQLASGFRYLQTLALKRNDKDASKPVSRHFNLPDHSRQHMTICGLSLHQGNTESPKNVEQKFIFQIGTLNPHGINLRFSRCHAPTNSVAPPPPYKRSATHNSLIYSDEGLTLETSAFNLFTVANLPYQLS